MAEPKRKSLHFVGSSRKAIRDMPDVVREVFGGALLEAQYGRLPQGARPFGEGVPRQVMKLVEDFEGDTYRAAFTVPYARAVYVLHVFKKKSKHGTGTPHPDRKLILTRLMAAAEHHRRTYAEQGDQEET